MQRSPPRIHPLTNLDLIHLCSASGLLHPVISLLKTPRRLNHTRKDIRPARHVRNADMARISDVGFGCKHPWWRGLGTENTILEAVSGVLCLSEYVGLGLTSDLVIFRQQILPVRSRNLPPSTTVQSFPVPHCGEEFRRILRDALLIRQRPFPFRPSSGPGYMFTLGSYGCGLLR